MLISPEFWSALAAIVVIDLVLAVLFMAAWRRVGQEGR